jgi:hypothetical protein
MVKCRIGWRGGVPGQGPLIALGSLNLPFSYPELLFVTSNAQTPPIVRSLSCREGAA